MEDIVAVAIQKDKVKDMVESLTYAKVKPVKIIPDFCWLWLESNKCRGCGKYSFTVQVWFNSAHNIVLDLLVWNGLPLGFLIIAYFAIWLFWLSKNAKDTISIVAILMVSAILMHAMLEFPQRYAYFLLPMGFLLGLIQAQTPNLNGVSLHRNIIRCVWLVSLIVLLLIWRDYKLFQENSNWFLSKPVSEEILGSSKILILLNFSKD